MFDFFKKYNQALGPAPWEKGGDGDWQIGGSAFKIGYLSSNLQGGAVFLMIQVCVFLYFVDVCL